MSLTILLALFCCCHLSSGSVGLSRKKGANFYDHFPRSLPSSAGDLTAATDAFRAWFDTRPPVRLGDEIHFGDNFFTCRNITEEVPIEEEYPVCKLQRRCISGSGQLCQAGCFVNVTDSDNSIYILLQEDDPLFLGEDRSLCNVTSALVERHCNNATTTFGQEEICALLSKYPSNSVVCRECNRNCSPTQKCKTVKKCNMEKRIVGIEDRVVKRICQKIV